ncbi:hypothetical protein O1M63_45165 [Streptomyces mirabilis]|nr:hypothetical protein [Streptomyces mirabilis]
MSDPRRVRGRRYHLGVLPALCLTRVLGEARFLAQTAGYAADTHPEVRAGLDPDSQAVRGSRTGSKRRSPAGCRPARQPDRHRPAPGSGQSNEIPAITALLARFDLRGVVVTADARPYG